MGERPSEYNRENDDWYVEPGWCVELLAKHIKFNGSIHDPCCGMGTIPNALNGSGSDIVDRGFCFRQQDFFLDVARYENIVTNPPYNRAQQIIEHALNHSVDRVAALVQMKFLNSQRRHGLFSQQRTEKVIVLSKRPSMPPGRLLIEMGENIRGNGSIDFCWVVWKQDHAGPATIEWA